MKIKTTPPKDGKQHPKSSRDSSSGRLVKYKASRKGVTVSETPPLRTDRKPKGNK